MTYLLIRVAVLASSGSALQMSACIEEVVGGFGGVIGLRLVECKYWILRKQYECERTIGEKHDLNQDEQRNEEQ
jgi:hypothetical protein